MKFTVLPETVIGIRTHRWTDAEARLYTQLQQYFDSKNIFLVVDETQNILEVPAYIQKVSLNRNYLHQNNLLDNHPNPNGLGWLCGDYFYYVLADYVDADYYWLIEPDVAFTFDDLSKFFCKFQVATQDAILHNFGKASDSWAWVERAKTIHHDVYQAFFPLSRLSLNAVRVCKQERQLVTSHFRDNNIALHQFPNDESLVATAVIKHGLNVEKLSCFWPNSFKYFTYRNTVLGNNAKNLLPANQVIHPFRQPEYLGNLLANQINVIEPTQGIIDLISRSILDSEDIDQVMVQIEKKAVSEIRLRLKRYSARQKLFLVIQKQFNTLATLSIPNIKYKSWVWKNNTLVLDATIHSNNQVYTLEYIFESSKLTCNIFSRSGDGKLMDFFRNNYPNFQVFGNKICLFNNSDIITIQDENIENAMALFQNTIESIDCEN